MRVAGLIGSILWPHVSRTVSRGSVRLEIVSSAAGMAALAAGAGLLMMSASEDGARAGLTPEALSRGGLAAPGKETMIAGYSGVTYTYPSDVTVKKDGVSDFTVKDVDWTTRPFENPIYYGWRIVRWGSSGRTGAMIDFIHSKEYATKDNEESVAGIIAGTPAPERAKVGDLFKRLEASHGHNMLTLNGLLRLPSWGFRISPYVGLGAGITLPHSEVHLAGAPSRTYEYQVAGPVVQAVLGFEIRLSRMSLFTEYKFTLAPYEMPLTGVDGSWLFLDLWRQLETWRSGAAPRDGRLTTRFSSHHAIAGLGVRIGPAAAAR